MGMFFNGYDELLANCNARLKIALKTWEVMSGFTFIKNLSYRP